jgi:uncharacterized protein YjeT (DUF2065 family)
MSSWKKIQKNLEEGVDMLGVFGMISMVIGLVLFLIDWSING